MVQYVIERLYMYNEYLTLMDFQELQPTRGFGVVPPVFQPGVHKLVHAQLKAFDVLHWRGFLQVLP